MRGLPVSTKGMFGRFGEQDGKSYREEWTMVDSDPKVRGQNKNSAGLPKNLIILFGFTKIDIWFINTILWEMINN